MNVCYTHMNTQLRAGWDCQEGIWDAGKDFRHETWTVTCHTLVIKRETSLAVYCDSCPINLGSNCAVFTESDGIRGYIEVCLTHELKLLVHENKCLTEGENTEQNIKELTF